MLLAPACVGCAEPLDSVLSGPVCPSCWSRLSFITPPVCDTCGDPLSPASLPDGSRHCGASCRSRSQAVDRARTVGPYDGVLRDLIHAMKYGGRRSLARPLGDLLARYGSDLVPGADFSVPVPLHWTRQWTRGFNQAEAIAHRLPLPLARVLVRTRRTRAQAELDASGRASNVTGAFALARRLGWQRWRSPDSTSTLQGATVVLVDDVSTTGATLDACAVVLKAAGVREVRALTVARTPRHRPRG